MKKKITKTEQLLNKGLIDKRKKQALDKVLEKFSLAIPETLQKGILASGTEGPLAKQFIPDEKELIILPNELKDPIGDTPHTPVKGIIHRYPDRCLFMPVSVCPVYCRFCFRREKVGKAKESLTKKELEEAFQYIETHPAIWEVILTGGDPFILKPAQMGLLLQRLKIIPHVEVIRFHTRVPVVDPERISKEMVTVLKTCRKGKQPKALYVLLHANHPSEFTPAALSACARIIDAGIPMLSQTGLFKGINDDPDTLAALMKIFVKNRIKPYYLHHADLAQGTSHFRTSIAEGQALLKALRGTYSGLCQPTYVLDIPGGHGKVPVGPHYLTEAKNHYDVEDYQGMMHAYFKE